LFFNFLNDHPKNCLFYCIIGTSSFRSYVLISCTMYCTTGHMSYLEVVYPHVQYPCNAPRVICTIVELYIHMYNINVLHHGSYVLSWSCISTCTISMYCTTGHMYYLEVVYPHVQYHCNAPRIICTIVELYIHIYNIHVLHHGSYVLSWNCISTCIISLYCTTGHMYYRGVVYPHVQYQCIAPRVICTIVELYIHMYNINVMHHGSYVLSWSCISTCTISL
jgi:methionine-rich copper-binding protein CopC